MTEHFEVLIIGAGLSGIGAAHHLQAKFPAKAYAILEARDTIGGTWDLFRYPGIRSDSDMHTLGYRFRPWTEAKAIADGPSILAYVQDTAAAAGIDKHVRFGYRVCHASFSSADARWTVRAEHDGVEIEFTCDFLLACSGYYRYDQGFAPKFPGVESFRGPVVYPQFWPDHLDYTGKRVVVIGSGATAVTLVPAMAETAAHVTMLQRSPTYIVALPAKDPIANWLRKMVGPRYAYPISRWKNVIMGTAFYRLSRRRPSLIKSVIRRGQVKQLPAGYDIDTHFTPSYNPWDQRLCVVPDGDLFRAIRDGTASVLTDRIETFTEHGIRLASGTEIEADIVVSATGLNLQLFGGATLDVDGTPVDPAQTLAYKGMMLGGVPNFAFTIGYTNASWTLKADLVSEYVCRLLERMDARGERICVPVNDDPEMPTRPLMDFAAGYVQRSVHELPKNGARAPWQLGMSYAHDVITLRHRRLDDGVMRFEKAPEPAEVRSAR